MKKLLTVFLCIFVYTISHSQIDCNLPIDVNINGGYASSYPSNFFSNKTIFLTGILTIDQTTTFNHCTFIMSGSKIYVDPDMGLYIESCKMGCGNWDGIIGQQYSHFTIQNSYFEKYTTCFDLSGSSGYLFQNNTFQSNETSKGIVANSINGSANFALPQLPFPQLGSLFITQNKFLNCYLGISLINCSNGIFIDDNEFNLC